MKSLLAAALCAALAWTPVPAFAGPPGGDPTATPNTAAGPELGKPGPPQSGAGLRTGGIILVTDGGLKLLGGVLLMTVARARIDEPLTSEQRQDFALAGGIIFGISALEIGGGIGMLVPGIRRRDALQKWELANRVAVPKDGNGMIVGGSVLLGLGALNAGNAALTAALTERPPRVFSLVVAGTELVVGSVLLGVGVSRNKKHKQWRRQRGFVARPYGVPTRAGASFGIAGAF